MRKFKFSVAIPEEVDRKLGTHLLRGDLQEDLCFAFWRPSYGGTRSTALIEDVMLPRSNDRNVHGNASFESSYFERALIEASRRGSGLALLHSHPFGRGWQDMSADDIRAECSNAPAVYGATRFPFVGLTLSGDRYWSARWWNRTAPRSYERHWCATVRVVGNCFRVYYMNELDPPPNVNATQRRTVSTWGEVCQSDLVRRKVAVVGAGSVGGFIAESLARTGVARIVLVDYDTVELHNLDRLCYATLKDLGRRKVDVLSDRLKEIATASDFEVDVIPLAVYEEKAFRIALDCDMIFSCVDRPWGRHVLNLAAYAHLIPVYDGGIAVRKNSKGKLVAADWRAHTATPGRACLQCLGQYDAGIVQAERDGYVDDPTYIEGLAADHPLKMRENVVAFSMNCAGLQTLQMLSHVISPLELSNPGAQRYHFVGGLMEPPLHSKCFDYCDFNNMIAKGDHVGVTVTGQRPQL